CFLPRSYPLLSLYTIPTDPLPISSRVRRSSRSLSWRGAWAPAVSKINALLEPCKRRQRLNKPNKALCAALFSKSTSSIASRGGRSEEHTSELQSRFDLVCRLLLEK